MHDYLYTIDEVTAMIGSGEGLLLAADEPLLRKLPKGKWIAGTIPYFMTLAGGMVDRQRIFVHRLPEGLACQAIRRYGEGDISKVYADLPPDSFGVIIAPASSPVHLAYALNAPTYPMFARRPLIGWIAGVHLSELGSRTAKVFDGTTGEAMEQQAVVMHVSLPKGKSAQLGIINIFRQGTGPAITFPTSGFSAREVDIDGTKRNLAEYIRDNKIDTRLPLVADYCGIDINVSFQSVDADKGEVKFYAPVFSSVPYHHAKPVGDYVAEFVSKVPKNANGRIAFSCNCILNYLHSGLEGRKTGDIACPITFGEVAYQLLNQTL
ncbi:MAG TPA: hypothetical protein VMK12_14065, partial [Anaeromyxobacteraceae bacterium]|nr:hypothetical protein [Anaeromyxobacteraceae bacterium]